MTGHYCKEHGATFFCKGKMKNFAHPIEGTDPTEWCNEPEEGGADIPEEAKGKVTEKGAPTPTVDPTRKSIERQTSLKCATEWCIAQLGSDEKPKTTTILSIATLFESYLDGGMGNLLDGKKADKVRPVQADGK